MSSEKKIGFLGGSFDPIHFGHIHLAIQMLEIHKLDQVLFCPAYRSPFKKNGSPKASEQHRLKMAELAVKDIKNFIICDEELKREGVSYTIDTIRHLQKNVEDKNANKKFYLILGEDALSGLASWKDVEELFQLASPLIGSRLASTSLMPPLPPFLEQKCKEGMTKMPLLEISSTEIRERLKKRLYCGHLVPAKVLDYIYENGLYYL
jgi:nicotinate-nucleotide adenylyltransferase